MSIQIASITLPYWNDRRTNVELWVFSNSDWTDADNIQHGAGNVNDKVWTQRVTGLTVDTTAKTITIPAWSIKPTTDANVNPYVRYSFHFMAVVGNNATPIKPFPNTENGIMVPPTIASITSCSPYGTCAVYTDLIYFSQFALPTPRPQFTYSDAQIDQKIAAATTVAGGVDLTSDQTVAGVKTFTGPTVFSLVPAADPGQGNTATASMFKGADSTSASPLSSANPSVYLQTIRGATGATVVGTQGSAQFGYLYNFQSIGRNRNDTYASYVLSRVSPDMTGASAGAYYHLAARNYIILNATNLGSTQVVGYGLWAQGETVVTGVSAYGAQIDSNNNSGVDASAEDFSSDFKLANIATNYTSNANVSAIIFSQGATNTSAYQGWHLNPNAVIRHILDFKDAFYVLGGTVAVTNGSGAIVGTGTKFLTDLVVSDQLQIVGVPYTVTAIADNTHATISPVYATTTASGLTVAKYVIPLRMAANSFITAENPGGTAEYRFAGLNNSSFWSIDPDSRGTVFGGAFTVNGVITAQSRVDVATNLIANNGFAQKIRVGAVASQEVYPGLWFGSATPDLTNYAFLYESGLSNTILNAVNAIEFRLQGALQWALDSAALYPTAATNTVDLGKTASRVRTGYFGTSVVINGPVNVATLTPSGSADAAGSTGDIRWDANFIYVKTGGSAWKRAALSTF